MSHYFLGVILPKDTKLDQVNDRITDLMAPFDECTGGDDGNEDGKWDWWVIGGRWDGYMTGIEVMSKDNGFNFGKEHRTAKKNSLKLTNIEILNLLMRNGVPCRILTPDGEWHDGEEDGEVDEGWDTRAKEILSKYVGHYIVGVDYHS